MRPSMDGKELSYAGLWLVALKLPEMKFWLGLATMFLGFSLIFFDGWVPLAEGLLIGGGFWLVFEYLLHRFLLHLPRPKQPTLAALHRRIHWQHHKTPDSRDFLFVPLWAAVPLYLTVMAIAWAVGGTILLAPAGLGLALLLGVYETTHLAAHVAYHPRTRLGALMKRHHLLHHYKNDAYWYGVTHPVMDMLLGTWRHRDSVSKSAGRNLDADRH